MVVGETLNIASSAASPGAAASARFDVPLTARLRLALTTSVVSTSATVSVPLVLSAASVSLKPAVSGPLLISGASLVPVTVIVSVLLDVPSLLSRLV